MKNFFLRSGIVLCVLFSLLYISKYSYLLKGIQTIYLSGHTTAFLEDYNRFSNDTVNTSNTTQPWPFHKSYNKYPNPEDLEDYHKNQRTVAYLIIKNDSILYEKYYDGFDKDTKSNSFSVVKSMVTAMLGIALKEGTIKSLDQKVIEFIPELKGPYASSVTVGDLSSMASGQKWGEAYYNPFSVTSAAYFVNSLDTLILNQPIHKKPGQTFHYQSGTTQLLGMVIKRATGKKLSDYLSEKLWKSMGAEHPALWQLDSDESGMEKAFCCLASNARDFARFGKLFKNFFLIV